MKKTTLLSFVTAATVVATTAGSFAAWDKLSETATAGLTLDKPVDVITGNFADLATTETAPGTLPIYTSTVDFTVSEAPATGYKLTPTVVIKKSDNTVVTDKFTAEVEDSKNADADVNGKHTLTVTVTPLDSAAAKALATAGEALKVEVTGVLAVK